MKKLARLLLIPVRSFVRGAPRAAILMMVTVAAFAQTRLYDPANDELAKKTRDAFAEFSKGDTSVFETMISNTLALKNATLAQLYDMNRQSVRDTVNLIPVQTWTKLVQNVEQAQQEFLDAYNSAQLILDPVIKAAPDAKVALAAAQGKLAKLKKDKDDKEAALNAEAPKLDKLKNSLQDVRNAVTASTKPVKKLSDLAEFQNLKDAWTGIQGLKDWFDAAEKSSNAPGLQLTILDLGVQHQQLEVARLQLEIEEADAAQRTAQRITQRLEIVWGNGTTDSETHHLTQGLFGQVYTYIASCSGESCPKYGFVTDQREQVLETAGKLATAANREVGTELRSTMQLRNLMDVLGRYVALVGYHKYLLLADVIESGTDTHLFAIRRSSLNTQERAMLLSHGLDGLAAYHAGGLKPEEIANFFRAAQAAATAALAGSVK
jgi:hypothetical protein